MPSSQPNDPSPDDRELLSDWKDAISRAMRGEFGPPGESLRSDIMEELADHLSESMKREERAGRDEAEARERVLKRFGSPSQIAARLWFDGMKGSIMFQRWMMGVSAAALLLAFVAVGLAFWMMQENNRVLVAAVERLDSKEQSSQQMDWTKLPFKAIDADTGEPIHNASFALMGNLISRPNDHMFGKTDQNGLVKFGPLRVGNLILTISPSEHWIYEGDFMVLPERSGEITIRCPVKQPEMTKVRIKLPSVINEASRAIEVYLRGYSKIDDREFNAKEDRRLMVTPDGRTMTIIQRKNEFLLGQAAQEIEIPAGDYKVHITYVERPKGWHPGDMNHLPDDLRVSATIQQRNFSMVAQPGADNKWVLPIQDELPKEWLTNAQTRPPVQ